MAQFSAQQVGLATAGHATNLANYVLTQLTAGNIASVKMISWGGSDGSLVSQVSRWARVNNTAVTPTALGVQTSSPGITPNSSVNTYATPAGNTTSPAPSLFLQSWNSQGGGGVIVLPIGGEWRVSGGALGTAYNQIGCGQFTGATSSGNLSFGVTFEE
jgi:hypothetical protein